MKDHEEKQNNQAGSNKPDEKPEIYSVTRKAGGLSLNRRTFLEATAAGALALNSVAAGASGKKDLEPGYAHKNPLSAMTLHPQGLLLASADTTGRIKLWQMPEGGLLKAWDGHNKSVTGLAFLPGKDKLVSTDTEGWIKVWSLPEGKALSGAGFSVNKSSRILIVPMSDLILTADERNIIVWNHTNGERQRTLETGSVKAWAATPDGSLLLTGTEDNTLTLWSLDGGDKIKTLSSFQHPIRVITLSPDGGLAVVALENGSIHRFNMPEPDDLQGLSASATSPRVAAIRPQKDWVALGRESPEIVLIPLSNYYGSQEQLKGHSAKVIGLGIFPDGKKIISGSADKTIRIWDLESRSCEKCLIDLDASYRSAEGIQYEGRDVYGRTVTYTLPCGSPIPPGAICICNCVPGSISLPTNHSRNFDKYNVCICDTICTCNTVCTCQSVGRSSHYWYPC